MQTCFFMSTFILQLQGQIEVYMNYIDKNLRKPMQDKTIGIILCRKDNKFIMEYCSDERIKVREYFLA